MNVTFTPMTNLELAADVAALMEALYREDEPSLSFDTGQFPRTVAFYVANPQRGHIVLFKAGPKLLGYAILAPIWSNEYGGTLLFIDELYVVPSARSQGIAHAFFEHLKMSRPFEAVAFGLEVSQSNNGARRLYTSIGFTARRGTTLMMRLPGHAAGIGVLAS